MPPVTTQAKNPQRTTTANVSAPGQLASRRSGLGSAVCPARRPHPAASPALHQSSRPGQRLRPRRRSRLQRRHRLPDPAVPARQPHRHHRACRQDHPLSARSPRHREVSRPGHPASLNLRYAGQGTGRTVRVHRGGIRQLSAHDRSRVDLGGQVLTGGGAGPGPGVLKVKFHCLAGERLAVFDLGVEGVLEQGKRGVGLRAGVAEGERAALLDGAQWGEVGEAGEQVLSCVFTEEGGGGGGGTSRLRLRPPEGPAAELKRSSGQSCRRIAASRQPPAWRCRHQLSRSAAERRPPSEPRKCRNTRSQLRLRNDMPSAPADGSHSPRVCR